MAGTLTVACEVLPGLGPVLAGEIVEAVGADRGALRTVRDGTEVRFEAPAGGLAGVLGLRCAVAAYTVVAHDVPRPRGLLGDRHLRRLVTQVDGARRLHPAGAFASFRLAAAGRHSPVFARLAAALGEATGLAHDDRGGDLVVRVRPAVEAAPGGPPSWETAVRLTPRPLSARPWRVVDVPGALNATIAAAMVRLSEPTPSDRVANLMAGTATLAVERRAAGAARLVVAVERDAAVLDAARANVAAARAAVALVRGDALSTPLPSGAFDVVLADPPWGHRMGSHDTSAAVHDGLLVESARLLRPGGRLVVVTHELRRFEAVLRARVGDWAEESSTRVFQKGHHPRIWVLRRR